MSVRFSPYEILTQAIDIKQPTDKFTEVNESSFLEMAIRETNLMPDTLMKLYFSMENVDYLQKRIQSEVKKLSDRDIKRQPDTALFQIMLTRYQEGRPGVAFNTFNMNKMVQSKDATVRDKLFSLNKAVLQIAVRGIISEMSAYMTHLKYLSTLPGPPSLPLNTSSYGADELVVNIGLDPGGDRTRSESSYAYRNTLIDDYDPKYLWQNKK